MENTIAETFSEALVRQQLVAWTHPRTGVVRYYPNTRAAYRAAGFEFDRYKSGGIASASLQGEVISNSGVRRIITTLQEANPYIAEGQVHLSREVRSGGEGAQALQAVQAWLESLAATIENEVE